MLSCRRGQSKDACEVFIIAARFDAHSIPHRATASLPLVPHSQQRRVASVDKVNAPQVGLAGEFSVQAARALLAPAFQ